MCLALFIWLWISLPESQADRICSKDVVCFITEREQEAVNLYIENIETFEVTVTIEAKLQNMKAVPPLPYTATIAGQSKAKAVSFVIEERRRPWHYTYSYYWTFGPRDVTHNDKTVYLLPYAAGSNYRISQGFHGRFSHSGENEYALDWNMPAGTPIYAAREGIVVGLQDKYVQGGNDPKYRDFANYLMLKHPDGTIGEYEHFQQYGLTVDLGQKVKAGDLLGFSGSVGYSTGPHLHFFVYRAKDGRGRQSFPIRFKTQHHPAATLLEGQWYTALTPPADAPGRLVGYHGKQTEQTRKWMVVQRQQEILGQSGHAPKSTSEKTLPRLSPLPKESRNPFAKLRRAAEKLWNFFEKIVEKK